MLICPNCRGPIEANWRVCPACGCELIAAPLVSDAFINRSQVVTVHTAPGAPAAPVLFKCPKCGHRNPEADVFDCQGPCGRVNLCHKHFDEEYDVCRDCGAVRRGAAVQEAELKRQREQAEATEAHQRGVNCHNKKDYDGAIAEYTRAIELDAQNAAYWWHRGLSYFWKSDYDRAIADYDRAIELLPQKGDYWYERGRAYFWNEDYDRAIADHNKAIALNPQKAAYWWDRGRCYYWKRDYDRAIADESRAIELDPQNPTYWNYRSHVYRAKGETARADADLAKARELGYKD